MSLKLFHFKVNLHPSSAQYKAGVASRASLSLKWGKSYQTRHKTRAMPSVITLLPCFMHFISPKPLQLYVVVEWWKQWMWPTDLSASVMNRGSGGGGVHKQIWDRKEKEGGYFPWKESLKTPSVRRSTP